MHTASMKIFISGLYIIMLLLVLLPTQTHAIYGLKDDRVHFAFVRFTPIDLYIHGERNENIGIDNVTVESYAVFSQPLFIDEADGGYVEDGTFYYNFSHVFDWFALRSRYTGGSAFCIYGGNLNTIIPDKEIYKADVEYVFDNVYPDTIMDSNYIRAGSNYDVAEELWDKVKYLNIPSSVASNGRFAAYGISYFNGLYQLLQHYLILHNIPILPEELIFAGMESPPGMMTVNVPVIPKIRLWNRGGKPADGGLRLKIRDRNEVVYQDEVRAGDILPDAIRTVTFKPFEHARPDSLTFEFSMAESAGDSSWKQSIEVIGGPVFRGYSFYDKIKSGKKPEAKLYGPDGNGSYDIITSSFTAQYARYWKNMANGEFVDYTENFTPDDLKEIRTNSVELKRSNAYGDIDNDGDIDSVGLSYYGSLQIFLRDESGELGLKADVFNFAGNSDGSLIFDYNNDGINDVFVMRQRYPSLLLRGEGNLVFTDVSDGAGPFPPALLGDAGDLNGDGYTDLILKAYYGYDDNREINISLHINQSGNSFSDETPTVTTMHKYMGFNVQDANYLRIIDLDGDGDMDIFGDDFFYANLGFNPIPTSIREEQIKSATPSTYNLRSAYPNPFNPSTTISFDLPEPANIRISIYSILGQRMAELVNENLPAGSHQRVWNASRFGSGIYLVRMEAKVFSKTVKITLLK